MAPADSAGVEDAQQVETLVAGRKKRLTAGNRMGVVMNVEGDDELTLLCASVGEGNEGEDQEYDGIEKGGSEADTGDSMSSSDDDGAFAETARDDLSGEKELQRSEKIDKAKQRRRLDRWSKRPRDRGTRSTKSNKVNDRAGTVEILHEDSAPNCAQAENATVGPPRSSLRKHTVQIRHETNRRAQETRERQKHQAEAQEATAKHRSTSKPKLMTQSERLSEAARVELHNSQSLNRWETAEAKRREDQRARFAALRDRRLDGPVITFLSSPAIWAGGHVVASGAQGVNNHWQRQCDQSGCFAPRCDQGDVPTSCGSHNCQYTMTYETAISATRDGVFTHTNHSAFSDPTRGPSSAAKPGELATQNLVVLRNSEGHATKECDLHDLFLAQRKKPSNKSSRIHPEPCAITGRPARFRDPETGLAYATPGAYRELRKLAAGMPQWSDLLGCYVGTRDDPSAGVDRGIGKTLQAS